MDCHEILTTKEDESPSPSGSRYESDSARVWNPAGPECAAWRESSLEEFCARESEILRIGFKKPRVKGVCRDVPLQEASFGVGCRIVGIVSNQSSSELTSYARTCDNTATHENKVHDVQRDPVRLVGDERMVRKHLPPRILPPNG